MMPLVTIVCPTYRRGRLLEKTIRSVLAQTERRWELILIDDASPDDTAHVAQEWARRDRRIRVLRSPERVGHPAGPRNQGTAASDAEFVAYLDHDDEWMPEHLEIALDLLSSTNAAATAAGYDHIDDAGEVIASSNHLEMVWHEHIHELGPLFEPSRVVVRRAAVTAAGGWRLGAGLEDWDLWMRIVDGGGRFATTVHRTTRLLQNPSTRRYSTLRPYRVPVGVFDTPHAADACRRELLSEESSAVLTRAALADVTRWYVALEESGTLVLPRGAGERIRDIIDATDRTHFSTAFREYHLLQRADAYELSLPVWSATRALAGRVQHRLRQVHTDQLGLISTAVSRHGGRPVGLSRPAHAA